MTCIVAYTDVTGRTWMGGDSGSFSGWDTTTISTGKVDRKGEFLMGYTGDSRGANLLRYAFTPPEIGGQDVDLMGYMVTHFVDKLRECFKGAGFATIAESKEGTPDGGLLVAVRGQIFVVYSDYSITGDTRPYHAIGGGAGYATGALWAALQCGPNRLKRDSEGLVRLAVEAAIEHNAGVRGPILVLSDAEPA